MKDFHSVLQYYLCILHNLVYRCNRGLISLEARDTALRTNMNWLNLEMYDMDPKLVYTEKQVDELAPEDKEKYIRDDFPLNSVIYYRDHEIPCYDDDAGQQVFGIVEGVEVSGGPFNLDYPLVFCSRLNDILQDELIQSIK